MSDLFENIDSKEDVKKITIYDEMKKSYLDYAMSVIVSRALPDVRDGLKPVHRRIIYTMYENGYAYNKPFKKSARVVGEVMGKYHPHGDSAIYDAMVRMAQDFSLRLPLIDGQGNFGSMDGDNAAAMRYTESRLSSAAHYLVNDIDKNTVGFKPNYDDSLQEPTVVPARYPNLLVNGASGIAVGMATNIPPHNLGELIDALNILINNEEATINDLAEVIKGPDFPTGGKILGQSGIKKALHTGKGSISICSVYSIEEASRSRSSIIISEIPWMVNKSKLVEEISGLRDKYDNKELDVISSVRDESDRQGVRVVVELKKDVEPEIVVNYLQKFTSFQVSFGINMLAIDNGIPKLMNVKEILSSFLNFRKEVVRNRTMHLLRKAREKAHVLAGLGIAVENIDEVIELIKASSSAAEARQKLLAKPWRAGSIAPYIELLDEKDRQVNSEGFYHLSEEQARSILELRLHRLTGLEREKIQKDLSEIAEEIKYYLEILSSYAKLMEIIKNELEEVKSKYANPRKTSIEEAAGEFAEEDFILNEEAAVTFTNSGYIKRMPITSYKTQNRGGKGKIGISTKEEDFVTELITASTHDDILFFTAKGLVYKTKCYKIPESQSNSVGRAIVNIINIEKDDKVTAILAVNKETDVEMPIVFVTQSGNVRKNLLKDFINIPVKGKIAMKLEDTDKLIGIKLASDEKDLLLSTKQGLCNRFPIESLRTFSSRNSSGVRGIKLGDDDIVINSSILNHEKVDDTEVKEQYLKYTNAKRRGEDIDISLEEDLLESLNEKEEFILTVTTKGFGKRSSSYDYRITNRGGKGVMGIKPSDKVGDIVASFVVKDEDEIILVSDQGQVIRQKVSNIRITGRVAAGVTLFKIGAGEKVVSVSKIASMKLDDEEDTEASSEAKEEKAAVVNNENDNPDTLV